MALCNNDIQVHEAIHIFVWMLPTKLNTLLAHDPAVILLDVYSNKLKIYGHTKTQTWVFISALFRITKFWKQPWCPSVGEWINKPGTSKQWNVIQCYKRNKLLSHEKTWGKPKHILLSERHKPEKATCCMISTIWHSVKGKTMKTVKKKKNQTSWGERDEQKEHRGFSGQWNDPMILWRWTHACVCAELLQSRWALCDPVDCSLPESPVHGNSPGKNTGVGWHRPPPGDLSDLGIEPKSLNVFCIVRRVLYH